MFRLFKKHPDEHPNQEYIASLEYMLGVEQRKQERELRRDEEKAK